MVRFYRAEVLNFNSDYQFTLLRLRGGVVPPYPHPALLLVLVLLLRTLLVAEHNAVSAILSEMSARR